MGAREDAPSLGVRRIAFERLAVVFGYTCRMWRPILEGEALRQATRFAANLTERLLVAREHDSAWDLAQRALICEGVGRALDERFLNHVPGLVDAAIDALPRRLYGPGLFGGVAGIGWIVEHVHLAAEVDSCALDDLDMALLEAVDAVPRRDMSYFDLIGGLVGIGIYGLERARRNPIGLELARRVAFRFEECAEVTEAGTTWWSRSTLSPSRSEWGFNLGLAHGLAGILVFLSSAYVKLNRPLSISYLIESSIRWLEGQMLSGEESVFPASSRRFEVGSPARSAWCYGDPGVATALFRASIAIRSERSRALALKAALTAARRRPRSSGVVDASLCHGSAGLAHIFNRLYQQTQAEELAMAARKWTDDLISRVNALDVQSALDHNLLEGASGPALILASLVSPSEPSWDRMILTAAY